MILVFLQNAYRKNGNGYRNREHWLRRMWLSHTGSRLKEMLPDESQVYVANANPRVGKETGAVFPPDLEHMQKIIDEINPELILGCGKVAQKGLSEIGVEYVSAPHPAWRALSKKETERICKKIKLTVR